MAVTGVRANGLSTSGKPELSSSCRSSAGQLLGRRRHDRVDGAQHLASRAPRTRSPGRLAEASGSATSHAATTTASACRIEPRVESTARKRSPVMRSRTRRPRNTPVVSPSTTSITTTATLTITRVFVLLMPWASSGATRTPMIAPPSTPTNDSSATAMPWRHPETAAISASAIDDEIDPAHQAPPGTAVRSAGARQRSITPYPPSRPRDLLTARPRRPPCAIQVEDPRGVPGARPATPIQQRGQ